jgi:hypothetical protein
MSRIVIVILVYQCYKPIDLNYVETLYGEFIYPSSSLFSFFSFYFSACCLLHAGFFLELPLGPENGGNMLLQSISRHPPDCMVFVFQKTEYI